MEREYPDGLPIDDSFRDFTRRGVARFIPRFRQSRISSTPLENDADTSRDDEWHPAR